MLYRMAFAPSDQRRILVRQQDSDWSDINLCGVKLLFHSLYEEDLLWLVYFNT
jgi:hypothetical protein